MERKWRSGEERPNVYFVEEAHGRLFRTAVGWFFWDEKFERFYGPVSTRAEAEMKAFWTDS